MIAARTQDLLACCVTVLFTAHIGQLLMQEGQFGLFCCFFPPNFSILLRLTHFAHMSPDINQQKTSQLNSSGAEQMNKQCY